MNNPTPETRVDVYWQEVAHIATLDEHTQATRMGELFHRLQARMQRDTTPELRRVYLKPAAWATPADCPLAAGKCACEIA